MENQVGFGEITCYAEHRLAEMVKERMEVTGETQQCAEIAVSRTEVGQKLWEESRRQCIKRSGSQGRAGGQKAGIEASDGVGLGVVGAVGDAGWQLGELVKARMEQTGESQQCAEINVIRTPEGLALWESARRDALKR